MSISEKIESMKLSFNQKMESIEEIEMDIFRTKKLIEEIVSRHKEIGSVADLQLQLAQAKHKNAELEDSIQDLNNRKENLEQLVTERAQDVEEECEIADELLVRVVNGMHQMRSWHENIMDSVLSKRELNQMAQEELLSTRRELREINSPVPQQEISKIAWKLKVLHATRMQCRTVEHNIKKLEAEVRNMQSPNSKTNNFS